jgi:hypothetical protein
VGQKKVRDLGSSAWELREFSGKIEKNNNNKGISRIKLF